jgi:hypothetical protein
MQFVDLIIKKKLRRDTEKADHYGLKKGSLILAKIIGTKKKRKDL